MEVMELYNFSSASTTTDSTTPCLSMEEDWAEWGTIVDWDSCIAGPSLNVDDLDGLINSFMVSDHDQYDDDTITNFNLSVGEYNYKSCTTTSDEDVEKDGKGVRIVHLLLAAAEALTGGHRSRDLAGVILVRLKELTSPAAAGCRWNSSNMVRLAAHFTEALSGQLDGVKPAAAPPEPPEKMAAFQLLQDMSPYVKFGHFTANQAILEAVAGERRVHVVDYDIMEGVQWASLMQALAAQTGRPHLRITALTRAGNGTCRKSTAAVQETGRRLAAFAATLDQPFSFHHCRLDSEERFRPSSIKTVKGESVVFNCMLHFSHRPRRSVASFLAGAAELGARVVTVVEEETSHGGFVTRFMDSLHHHSAICDSLEAGFPNQARARGLVERAWLGPKIIGSVAWSFRAEDGEGNWSDWMESCGFLGVGLSYFNHCQARLLVGLFNEGYSVEEAGVNKLVLGWKNRRLLSASAWSPPRSGSGSPIY